MSTTHVVTMNHDHPRNDGSCGFVIVDTCGAGMVNLDLNSLLSTNDGDEYGRYVTLAPDEARALAAVLDHYADECDEGRS